MLFDIRTNVYHRYKLRYNIPYSVQLYINNLHFFFHVHFQLNTKYLHTLLHRYIQVHLAYILQHTFQYVYVNCNIIFILLHYYLR